jgi:CBS domain-containing protein
MTPAGRLAYADAHEDAAAVLERLARRQVNQLPVLEHGELRGIIRREDIMRWIALYGGEDIGNAV